MTLATLFRRAEKAQAKAWQADDAARAARSALNAEALRLAWAALAKRGIHRGDRIGFTDPKRARWHNRAPHLDAIEAYRSVVEGKWCWRVRLRLTAVNAKGKRLKSPLSEYFDLTHPRDIARQVVKAALAVNETPPGCRQAGLMRTSEGQ